MTPLEAAAKAIRDQRSRRLKTNLDSVADADAAAREDARVAIREAARLIADDAYAITFQTMGQYRTALLRALVGSPSVSSSGGEK